MVQPVGGQQWSEIATAEVTSIVDAAANAAAWGKIADHYAGRGAIRPHYPRHICKEKEKHARNRVKQWNKHAHDLRMQLHKSRKLMHQPTE